MKRPRGWRRRLARLRAIDLRVWVALATLLALLLRLCGIGEWSFWVDEAHTYRDATMPLLGERNFWDEDRGYYPLTFLGLRFLLDIPWYGQTEGWLRLPFALVGAATVPLMWRCGRDLVGDGAALFAAFLLALMPWHVFWSQSARGYVFVVLSGALATGLLWRWAAHGKAGDLAGTFVAIGIGALFHPTAALLVCGVVAFLILRRLGGVAPGRVAIAVASAAVVLLALPWLIREFAPMQEFLRSKTETSVTHIVSTTGYFFRPLLLVAAVAGFLLLRRRFGGDRALLLACAAAVPLLVLTILGGFLAKATARYAIASLPALLWLGAAAASELVALARPRRALGLTLAAGFAGVALVVDFAGEDWQYYVHRHGDRARWRQACEWLQDRFPGEPIHVLTVNEPSVKYYFTPEAWRTGGAAAAGNEVFSLEEWHNKGVRQEVRLHPPGWRNHLSWRRAAAEQAGARLAVLITRPELEEIDRGQSRHEGGDEPIDAPGALWRLLHEEFELVEYLPCRVGPKDESIRIFVRPRP